MIRDCRPTGSAKRPLATLDDTVVCLGAGIRCTDGTALETTVENRNLGPTGGALFVVDGTTRPAAYPWSATLTGATWARIGGHGGYVFPGGATVKALRDARDGRWSDMDKGGSTTVLNRGT
ncbi:hypothetical protein AQJ67_20705 [Streptomyces caeruleatus]|uniref:Polysaccharide lyase family 8 central domain-containing protein n=1 Tax=Streptomyces caeruleatus TaxID=661399 RepID=A0A101U2E5_9ACTN|nr:hypothetical protein AQJ67_20705 [Streptomyces caeruleatus]